MTSLLRWLLGRLLEPGLRDEFFSELEHETDRLRRESGDAIAERWLRRQLLTSIWPVLVLRAAPLAVFDSRPRLGAIVHDVRFAVRALARRPAFTALSISTLALAIGSNVAIFCVINGVFFKGVPGLASTSGLVEISQDVDGSFYDLSYPVILNAREQSRALEDLAALTPVPVSLGGQDEPAVHMSLAVSGNYFDLLRLAPARGRFFAPEESFHPNAGEVVVISHSLWERLFDLDPEVIGATVRVNRRPLQIIGVAPPGFAGHWVGLQIGLWIPIGAPVPGLPEQGIDQPFSSMFEVLGRLAPDATAEQAAAELGALSGAFLSEASADYDPSRYRARVAPWAPVPATIRRGVTAFLGVLAALVALVLTMAATNVANMILARSTERRAEIAARLSLGASRSRVVAQLLTESVLLFVVAGAIGVAGAAAISRLLLAFEPPLPPGFLIDLDLGLDVRVLGFALVLSALSGLAFSLLPALRATRPDLLQGLRDLGFSAPARSRLRAAMVGIQMAATVVLLIAAGLFSRALRSVASLDPGFETDGVLAVDLDLELTGHSEQQGDTFYQELLERVRAIPGVDRASLAAKLPLAGRSSFGEVSAPGIEPPPGRRGFDAFLNRVSDGYFPTLGIDLLEGRDLSPTDVPGGPLVAVVNRAMAERLWPGERAVGQGFQVAAATPYERRFEVVGVVENAKYRSLSEETQSFYYVAWRQFYSPQMTLQVKSGSGGDDLAGLLRQTLRGLEPDLPITVVAPLERRLELSLLPQRIGAWVSGVLGFLGLLLGALGVYGVTTLIASQRTHEMGVRIALGARPGDIVGIALRDGLLAPGLGMAAGLAVAFVLSRFLVTFLATVSPLDPLVFGTVAIALPAIAAAAAWVPARRVARLDPVSTLRGD